MECLNCHAQNKPEARFCSRCGTPLTDKKRVSTESERNSQNLEPSKHAHRPVSEDLYFETGTMLWERYLVMGLAGQGGMGVIYQVHDVLLDEDRALKIMLPSMMIHERIIERFLKEARISVKLNHPNIVRVYHVDRHEYMYYLVMEYLTGCNLWTWVEQQPKPVSLPAMVHLILQVCDALEYAHKEIIHRDIKPGNIFITQQNQVKLLDFGIARLKEPDQRTSASIIMGTIDYMAPEQFSTPDKVDNRVDIYSLGAVLYDIVAGEVGLNRSEPLSTHRKDVPPALDAITARCLAKNRQDRFRHIGEVRIALERLLQSLPDSEIIKVNKLLSEIPPVTSTVNTRILPTVPDSLIPEELLEELNAEQDHVADGKKAQKLLEQASMQAERLEQTGDYEGALAVWSQILAEHPDMEASASDDILRLHELLTQQKKDQLHETQLEALKTQARQQEADGDFAAALRSWKQAWEMNPNDPLILADIDRLQKLLFQQREQPSKPKIPLKMRLPKLPFTINWQFAVIAIGVFSLLTICFVLFSAWYRDQHERNILKQLVQNEITQNQQNQHNGQIDDPIHATAENTFSAQTMDAMNQQTAIPGVTGTPAAPGSAIPQEKSKETEPKKQTKKGAKTSEKAAAPPPKYTIKSIKYDMTTIPGGVFKIGSPSADAYHEPDELQFSVTISKPFYLGVTEVTQAQWQSIMRSNPSHFEGNSRPVDSVSWLAVVDYCNRLSKREKLPSCYVISGETVSWDRTATGFRLPTEAEWEFACRATTTGSFYTGNSLSCAQANIDCRIPTESGTKGAFLGSTCTVASYPPNPWGLYDMHGNVWEWCWDWYADYQTGVSVDPAGPLSGHRRVYRGGAWSNKPRFCRSANRDRWEPSYNTDEVGFRLARSIP